MLAAGAPVRVLMVDDSEDDAMLVLRSLRQGGRDVVAERVEDAESMRASLLRERWDVVTCDWTMPSFGGAAALALFKSLGLDIPFIIVSGTTTEEIAVAAMRSGACDWVPKDKIARLAPAIERELWGGISRARNGEALKRSHAQLRQSQKMDAVGNLAAGVSHDFNNLLSVIIGYAGLLLREVKPGDTMHESIAEIRGAAQRAAALTRQLLAFSRKQILQPQVTDLNEVMTGMENMLKRLIGEDLELTSLPGPNLERVMVDRGHIGQVILNLVVNARDAMPLGGKLTIETQNIELDEDFASEHLGVIPGPHVMLAISDTGTGMDEPTMARIFEPFFTTKELGQGTGLGLATVIGIVRQSGGTIWTYSELGLGTTFKVYLPIATPIEAAMLLAAEPVSSREAPRGTETILLVEDDDSVRRVVRTILQQNGYQVVDVPNGREAIQIADTCGGSIDLLVTDVVMPRMSGRELSHRLHLILPGLKVLYVSGYAEGAIARHGVLEPGIAFLQKPIAPDLLLQKVRDVLDSARARA